jgi:hypothetical protein
MPTRRCARLRRADERLRLNRVLHGRLKSDYEVGYGKPPEATQFKRSTSANPKGRPKRKPGIVGDVIKDVLKASVEYREGGQTERRLVETSPSLQSVAGEFYG